MTDWLSISREMAGIEAKDYQNSVAGFQGYLNAWGIEHFSAKELTTPNHPEKAKEAGYDILLPPQTLWVRGAVLALCADYIRNSVREPVHIRNWWRPNEYNKLVAKSGPDSDHPHACAIDMDFRTSNARSIAENLVAGWYEEEAWQCSRGLGDKTIHLGFLSPKGRRTWYYDSYKR